MKKLHTYTNSFHNTEARSAYSRGDFRRAEWGVATGKLQNRDPCVRAARRLKDKLCGARGCTCSDWKGERT